MNWQRAIERTVTGLGYDLVDTERSAGGLLRVYIDRLPEQVDAGEFVTVDDCEKVTRQLQHVLEVEGCAYERLEVSSPGLDRPLKKAADYARFCGEQVELSLKEPFQGRKKWRGELRAGGEGNEAGWRIVLTPADPSRKAKPVKKASSSAAKKGAASVAAKAAPVDAQPQSAPAQALDFLIEEVREARLVPVLDFKGKRFAPKETAADTLPGSDDEVDGDRIQ